MSLYDIENKLYNKGYSLIGGIDEAGRGPLCGPVCAACVIMPKGLEEYGINDSKKLSEKKREALFDVIKENSVSYGIGIASPEEIDKLNILNATFLAMKRAVEQMPVKPQIALVDGNRDPKLSVESICVVKGDSKSISIAAASILAKVTRDRIMAEISLNYPEYNIAKHKGYPTKEHYELIHKYGVKKEIYRMSFLKNLEDHK